MYKYPYGDSQQLNLDWILAKLKELEASGGAGGTNLEEVSNALLSLTYNSSTAYQRYDYAFHNDKLYRCLSNTTGTFDPDAWQEALIGDDLAVLTRWINAIDAAAVVDVKFDTSGTNGKIQQKYHDQYHDVVEVDYTPVQNSKRPLSSNAGYDLNGAITEINDCLEGKTIVLLGDSNAYNWGASNPFSNIKDVTFHNLAVGGAVYSTQNTNNIEAQYNTMVAAGYTPDYIILWAGGNDISVYTPNWGIPALGNYSEPTETTTFPSVRRLLYKLRTTYPTTKLLGITREDKVDSAVPRNRFNYVMGMLERIYQSWSVPILSLNTIINFIDNLDESRTAYIDSGNAHYKPSTMPYLTRFIVNALRGNLNTQSARTIEQLFAPTGTQTTKTAVAWVVDSLFSSQNWWLEQKGYTLHYIDASSNWRHAYLSVIAPQRVLVTDDNGLHYIRDRILINGTYDHDICFLQDSESEYTTLAHLPDGITTFRVNQFTANTAGLPTELAAILPSCAGRLIGSNQNNGRWQGMMVCCWPTSGLAHVAYTVYIEQIVGLTIFHPIDDPSITYTGSYTP